MSNVFNLHKIQTVWSTPKIMALLMLVGMILIYSFETMGLANGEQNIKMRQTNPEILIKKASDAKHSETYKSALILENENNKTTQKEIQLDSLKEKNLSILMEGVINQYSNDNNESNDDLESFDNIDNIDSLNIKNNAQNVNEFSNACDNNSNYNNSNESNDYTNTNCDDIKHLNNLV